MITATPWVDLPVGWRLVTYDVLDSTNSEVRRLAVGGSEAGEVVRAVVQTAGRGRGVRIWHSPAGNLYFSVLLRPQAQPAQLALVGFVAGVAVVEGITIVAPALGSLLFCKWPNDILCRGRKLCGILLEGELSGDLCLAWVVIGVGLNVVWAPDAAAIRYPATSLVAEGIDVTPEIVLRSICCQLAAWFNRWQTEGFAPVRSAWLARAEGVGRLVTVRLNHTSLSGVFAGLDHDGALLIETVTGDQRRVLAGDVSFQ